MTAMAMRMAQSYGYLIDQADLDALKPADKHCDFDRAGRWACTRA